MLFGLTPPFGAGARRRTTDTSGAAPYVSQYDAQRLPSSISAQRRTVQRRKPKIRSILSGFPFKTPYLRWLLYPALNAMGADAKIVTTVTAVVKRRSRKIVA
jgi:hypothetical protein